MSDQPTQSETTDAQVAALQAQVADLQKTLDDARMKLQAADADRHDLLDQLHMSQDAHGQAMHAWRSDVQELREKISAAQVEECKGNHVSLDGEKYDVLWRSTVKDLCIEGYQKKYLDENHTALVIAKHGG